MRSHIHAIGIMTGNSLDGADLVLTRFGPGGEIVDLGAVAVPYPEGLKGDFRRVRAAINARAGRVEAAVEDLGPGEFDRVLGHYTTLLAGAVATLRENVGAVEVDVIGLHGQTCAHRPPSIAGTARVEDAYTVQVGDGRALADAAGVAVVCDFRSDDLMAGGEGAPLAPIHHGHLADLLRRRGAFPIAFANGGNTGNLSVISADEAGATRVLGWDAGPFNDFPDRLMQLQAGQACDLDAAVGRRGAIHPGLLVLLFDRAVVTGDGGNFLLRAAPKSSDPEWYRLLPELLGAAPVDGRVVAFEDRVRTATYFATYVLVHSLGGLPTGLLPPKHLAACGGGWRNPLTLPDLHALLAGDPAAPVLPEHADRFRAIRARLAGAAVVDSAELGFDGTAMEARIFADAAACRARGEPFTRPETTGAARPTLCGIIRFPGGERSRATEALRAALDGSGAEAATLDLPDRFDPRWSRAAAGWADRLPT